MKPKFRAYHILEEKMCKVTVLTEDGAFLLGVKPGKDQVYDGGKGYIEAPKDGRFCKSCEFNLMQFTGKHDKEGTEIYDGDIIEFDEEEWYGSNPSYLRDNTDKSNIHKVEWDDRDASWCWGGGTTSDMHFRKVIGNIYDSYIQKQDDPCNGCHSIGTEYCAQSCNLK